MGNHSLAKMSKTSASKNIVWKFNLERAPWQGGFFERLVQSIKRPLRKIGGNARLRYNEMLTVLCEIEQIVNNRPLTYVYEDLTQEPFNSKPSFIWTQTEQCCQS